METEDGVTKQRLKRKTLVRLKPAVRSAPSTLDPSEFGWPTGKTVPSMGESQNGDQSVKGLISALKDVPSTTARAKLGDLKKHLSTTFDHHSSALRAPIADRTKERLERGAAYRRAAEEVGDWDEVVRRNRLADRLEFPLFTEPLRLHTAEERIRQFEPRTNLEIETARLLASSKHNLRNADPLTEAEKEALKSLSLEEARERRARLQKMRALVSYAERKLRWQNKIKSKRYHRLLKRRDRKKTEKEFQEMLEKDPAAALEKLEMLERDRIKERASLKHRSTGKWAKQVRRMAKKDPRLREALQDQLRKGREMAEKKRVQVDEDSEQDDAASNIDDADGNEEADKRQKDKWAAAQPMLEATPRLVTNVAAGDEEDDGNQALMAEAFAEDDIMDEFRAELEADIDKGDKEAVDSVEAQLSLPGWNSWTGPGTDNLKANRKRREQLEGIKKKQEVQKRKRLSNWPLVKISQEANESVRRLQVSNLPFPFSSTRDFEANLEPPLGKEWNPETVHQSLVQSGVQTKMGAVIQPLSRDLALKKTSGGKGKAGGRTRRKGAKTNRKDVRSDDA